MNKYYVYVHMNPYNNEIFYVGKGSGRRKNSNRRNDKWLEYTSKLDIPHKVLVLKENLSEKESYELEKKVLMKIDFNYDDLTTNIENSDFSYGVNIGINPIIEKSESKPRFENYSDKQIIDILLDFPNEDKLEGIYKNFEIYYDELNERYSEFEEIDEDNFIDVETVVNYIYDFIEEYKVSEGGDFEEFLSDLEREKVDLEFVLEEKPKEPLRKFIVRLINWIDSVK